MPTCWRTPASGWFVNVKVSNPALSAQLTGTTTDANLLANPRVRVVNKQKAKVLIGERLPVITATTTANVGTSDTVSYLDVGLKLEIEPTISLDDEVSMNVALEVSNVLGTTTTNSGTQAYTLGTRNTSTSLQVHDGETNILAGLIQRDRSHSNTGVPGLNELPLVNRLFGAAQDNDTRTEIILLITPHIVRSLDVPGMGQQEFLSGTEAATGAGPIQLGQPAGRSSGAVTPPGTQAQPPRPATPPQTPPSTTPQVYPPPTSTSQPAGAPALTPPTLVPTSPGTR